MPVLRFRQGAESGTSGNELAQCDYGADMAVCWWLQLTVDGVNDGVGIQQILTTHLAFPFVSQRLLVPERPQFQHR